MNKLLNAILARPNIFGALVLAFVFFGVVGAFQHWFGPVIPAYPIAAVLLIGAALLYGLFGLYRKR